MKPVYDLWSAFFLVSSVAGVISSLLILFHYRHSRPALWIGSLTLLFSITIADWLIYWTKNQPLFPHLFLITFFFNFLYGPFFYFYLKALAGDRLSKFQRFIHFIPFLTVILVCAPLLFSNAAQKKEIILHGFRNSFTFYAFLLPFCRWLCILVLFFYSFLSLKLAARFSLYQSVHKWSIIIIASFCIFCLNFLIYEVLSRMSFFNPLWDYGIAVSMILMMFVLVVSAYVQPQVFNGFTWIQSLTDVKQDSAAQDVYVTPQKNSSPVPNQELSHTKLDIEFNDIKNSPAEMNQLLDRLNELMIHEKLYTRYDLRLDTIAEKLYVSRKKISNLINDKFEMNFFDYINTMRIEEAKRMLISEPRLSIKEIMYTVGFNNKVSFYKAFKNKTGLTPTDYKMHMLVQDESAS